MIPVAEKLDFDRLINRPSNTESIGTLSVENDQNQTEIQKALTLLAEQVAILAKNGISINVVSEDDVLYACVPDDKSLSDVLPPNGDNPWRHGDISTDYGLIRDVVYMNVPVARGYR